jgi:hypothetical protein
VPLPELAMRPQYLVPDEVLEVKVAPESDEVQIQPPETVAAT